MKMSMSARSLAISVLSDVITFPDRLSVFVHMAILLPLMEDIVEVKFLEFFRLF